jgi:hypothetical protein
MATRNYDTGSVYYVTDIVESIISRSTMHLEVFTEHYTWLDKADGGAMKTSCYVFTRKRINWNFRWTVRSLHERLRSYRRSTTHLIYNNHQFMSNEKGTWLVETSLKLLPHIKINTGVMSLKLKSHGGVHHFELVNLVPFISYDSFSSNDNCKLLHIAGGNRAKRSSNRHNYCFRCFEKRTIINETTSS